MARRFSVAVEVLNARRSEAGPRGRTIVRIVVTGSSGLVGAGVLTALRAAGHDAVPFDIRRPGTATFEDVCDLGVLSHALAGADGVVHLAAISRVAWGEAHPALCDAINIGGVRTVLDAISAGSRKAWLVLASSREVYGDVDEFPVPETTPVRPINTYARSKAAGEAMVEAAIDRGLRAAIIRLSSVYGSIDDHGDRAVPSLLSRALADQPLTITGAGHRFDFVHVDDTVRGLLAAVALLGAGAPRVPTVHLASGVGTTLGELAALTVTIARTSATIERAPARPFDVKGFVGDPGRAVEALGWRAAITLPEGLARLASQLRARQLSLPLPPADIPDPATLKAAWQAAR